MIQLTTDISQLQKYLQEKNWLLNDESLMRVEIPGEGNMNFTLRLVSNTRSIIIKQSRDYVEKYPQVAAPSERIIMEARFYELISNDTLLKSKTPNIIALDKQNHIMLMEDLGAGKDFTHLYQKGNNLEAPELVEIVEFISVLHKTCTSKEKISPLTNKNMRKLNHEHIFIYPFMKDNGFNLDDVQPGLEAFAQKIKEDQQAIKAAEALGEVYLSDGNHLLHGDYFPGSWLQAEEGIKIIDPEFSFYGKAEFEIGVMLAHLKLAQQPHAIVQEVLKVYDAPASFDQKLTEKFTSIEIIRRLIGLAQLPVQLELDEKIELLEEAIKNLKF